MYYRNVLNLCPVGEICSGYSIDQIEEIPELNADAILLSHKNGSRHLHISREDSNNCFRYFFV